MAAALWGTILLLWIGVSQSVRLIDFTVFAETFGTRLDCDAFTGLLLDALNSCLIECDPELNLRTIECRENQQFFVAGSSEEIDDGVVDACIESTIGSMACLDSIQQDFETVLSLSIVPSQPTTEVSTSFPTSSPTLLIEPAPTEAPATRATTLSPTTAPSQPQATPKPQDASEDSGAPVGMILLFVFLAIIGLVILIVCCSCFSISQRGIWRLDTSMAEEEDDDDDKPAWRRNLFGKANNTTEDTSVDNNRIDDLERRSAEDIEDPTHTETATEDTASPDSETGQLVAATSQQTSINASLPDVYEKEWKKWKYAIDDMPPKISEEDELESSVRSSSYATGENESSQYESDGVESSSIAAEGDPEIAEEAPIEAVYVSPTPPPIEGLSMPPLSSERKRFSWKNLSPIHRGSRKASGIIKVEEVEL